MDKPKIMKFIRQSDEQMTFMMIDHDKINQNLIGESKIALLDEHKNSKNQDMRLKNVKNML